MNINKAIIGGYISQKPEEKKLPSGISVTNLSVATNKTYTKDGEKIQTTEFHNVVAFGKTAENIAKFFNKGERIMIEGEIQTRTWEDQQTGKKMYRTEIIANSFHFIEKKSDKTQTTTYADYGVDEPKKENPVVEYPQEDINPDDIPF